MNLFKKSSFLALLACAAIPFSWAQTPVQDPTKQDPPKQDPAKQEPIKVPKVAMIWTYCENERGTSEGGINTSQTLLKKLFEEKAGFEVISDAVSKAAWRDINL